MKSRWLMAVAAASVVIAGSAEAQSGLQGPIKIAVVGPFSGRGAEAGERVASAVKMALLSNARKKSIFAIPVCVRRGSLASTKPSTR